MMSESLSRTVSYGVTAIAVVLAVRYWEWGGAYDRGDVKELAAAGAVVEHRVDSLQVVLDSVTIWADSLETDPGVIERVARERHSFIRPGERLYLFVEEPSP